MTMIGGESMRRPFVYLYYEESTAAAPIRETPILLRELPCFAG
ncbi:hypothetical protein DB29_01295 [Shouchella clausii]|nr:hypothetical protein DB29_01295 [Shouchella clausii]